MSVHKTASPRARRTSFRSFLDAPVFEAPNASPVTDPVDIRTCWQRRYAAGLRVTDMVAVCAAVALAHHFQSGRALHSVSLVCVWLSALSLSHTRSPGIIGSGIQEYRRVVAASLSTFGTLAVVTLLIGVEVPGGYLAVVLPAGIFALVLNRQMWRKSLARKRAQGNHQTAVLVIGKRDVALDLAAELTRDPKDGYRVVGFGIPGHPSPGDEQLLVNGQAVPIVCDAGSVPAATYACGADTVAIAETGDFGVQGIRRLIWDLEPMGVDLVVSPCLMDVAAFRLTMRPVAGLPLLHIRRPQYRAADRIPKRAFDYCFALLALAVASPVLVLAAFAIKINSEGPVLYRSERIGIDGKPFLMFKLRTMVQDAEQRLGGLLAENECEGLLFKMRDDPRVTRIGRILRRFSIDELPQFFNVLRLEMSIVGPRPPLRREVEAYDGDVRRRLLVKPGITGLWQISGRSDLPWGRAVRLDLSYVDNWSLVADMVIIVKTIRAVLHRTGAY